MRFTSRVYFIFTACQCNPDGTKDGLCEANGNQCPCKDNYAGAKCDQCARGFYNFPQCVGKLVYTYGIILRCSLGKAECNSVDIGKNM